MIGGNLNIHGTEVALTKDFKVRPGLSFRIQGFGFWVLGALTKDLRGEAETRFEFRVRLH